MMWLLFGGRKVCTWHQEWSCAPVSRAHCTADFQGIISLLPLMRELGWSPGTLKPLSNSGLSPWPAMSDLVPPERDTWFLEAKAMCVSEFCCDCGGGTRWLWPHVLQKLELCLGLLEIWNNLSVLMMTRRDKQLEFPKAWVFEQAWVFKNKGSRMK